MIGALQDAIATVSLFAGARIVECGGSFAALEDNATLATQRRMMWIDMILL